MSEGLSDDAFVPDTPSFAIFMLMKCGEPEDYVRFWSGIGDFRLAPDAVDTDGGTYKGLPFPQGLPELSQALNGAFQGIEFSLSGVNTEILRLAGVDRNIVDGARVHLGIMDLGDNHAPVGGCDWLFQAIAGKLIMRRMGQGDQAVRAITLPATTAFKDRLLAPLAYLTPTGQRSRSSDDAFCDMTPAYSAASTIKWPG